MDKGCPAASTLELKVDAQVVLVWNLSQSLVNGSRGVVTGLSAATGLPVVRFNNGEVKEMEPHTWTRFKDGRKASRTQIPLKLAW
ncbi:MAG: ATP-dependent endonuclease, partial [Promethearchaeia archaeon]